MRPNEIPKGYTTVLHAARLEQLFEFCVAVGGLTRQVAATAGPAGVVVKPVPHCGIAAIVELAGRTRPGAPTHNWHVGFVQSLIEGELAYLYSHPASDQLIVAAMAPETVPCKDSGSADGTWYDPSPFSHKAFGGPDFVVDVQDEAPEKPSRCYSDPNVRFVYTEDAPGSGKAPILLPCKGSTDRRAVVGKEYTIGWTDPLDPTSTSPTALRLSRILGSYTFITWLAVSPNGSKTTREIHPLYQVKWRVDYTVMVDASARSAVSASSAEVVSHQAVGPLGGSVRPILTPPDANDLSCVRFRTRL